MNTITNISGLSVNFPMENTTLFNNKWQNSGIFFILFNNNLFLRNCEKPHVEPHLFPYVVSETLENECFVRPEAYRVVEIGRENNEEEAEKEEKKNNNNDYYDCDSYRCYNDNCDNNHCISNVVRVPFMCSFDLSKVKENIRINIISSIMSWFTKRTYKPSANTHGVGGAYGKEGCGDKVGLSVPKAAQAVSGIFSRTRWSNIRLMVKTRSKRIFDTSSAIVSVSSSRLGLGSVGKGSSFKKCLMVC